jgi:NAD-dependent deacetylase
VGPVSDESIRRARDLVDAAQRIVVLTGAGISTDSGIPDFRGPQGVWTKNPGAEKTATLQHYVADAEVRRQAWRNRVDSPAWAAEPNGGHRAVVALEQRGKLHLLVTQNVDELHQRAGTSPDKVVEVHGTMRRYACLACGAGGPMADAVARVRAGEDDPACERCGGMLKSATISFGQQLVEADLVRADAAARSCDLLLAVGTSLSVYPIADIVPLAAGHGVPVIIVNAEPTQFDRLAEVVLRGSISELLPLVCEPG